MGRLAQPLLSPWLSRLLKVGETESVIVVRDEPTMHSFEGEIRGKELRVIRTVNVMTVETRRGRRQQRSAWPQTPSFYSSERPRSSSAQAPGSKAPASASLMRSPMRNGVTPSEIALVSPVATGTPTECASHPAPKT